MRITDWGRMVSADVLETARPTTEEELQQIVRRASQEDLKISLRGIGHSAGGQSFRSGGIMVDMLKFNRILKLDAAQREVRVQTGASWLDLTRVLEPHRLAITTKQEFDTFTVGGSVAANVHGKTIDQGPLIESIREFRLLNAEGNIVTVNRKSQPDLFRLVIGGYGLFGIVVDVTFRLIDDRPVIKSEVVRMDLKSIAQSYVERVRRNPKDTPLCYGFLNSQCTEGFYVTYTYANDGRRYELNELKRDEPNPLFFDLMAALFRHSDFLRNRGFQFMWSTSAKPEVTLRSRRLLLWDHAPKAFQKMLLQKFYIPLDRFVPFVQKMSEILSRNNLPTLTNHFRYVPASSEAFMNFAPTDTISVIPCYFAEKGNQEWLGRFQKASASLLDVCLDEGGRHYLTFDAGGSKEQFHRAYPQAHQFFEMKRKYDPREIFNSEFYAKYR